MSKLSDSTAMAAPAGSITWDCPKTGVPGFGVRVTKAGARSWVVRYRVGGKQVMKVIGTVAGIAATKARKQAGDFVNASKVGIDKAEEAKARHAVAAGAMMQAIFAAYLDDCDTKQREGRIRAKTVQEARRALTLHAKPLARKLANTITRKELADWKKGIRQTSGARTSDLAASYVAAAFDQAILEGVVDRDNPARKLPKAGGVVARDRVLSDAELKAIWHHADPATDYGAIVRLLMLTGQRREEIGCVEDNDIDAKERVLLIPAFRAKNKRAHAIYLAQPAWAILKPRKGRTRLFGSNPDGNGFSGWSKAKARLDEASGVVDWRLHDLRRTAATGMASLGIAPHIVEAALNHVSGFRAGVAGVYNRHQYRAEIREAMIRWAWHVRRLAR